jgi:outer membrane lipoprotein-sorting protein
MNAMSKIALVLFSLACAAAAAPPAAPDPEAILQSSDHARGGGLPGIRWDVTLVSNDSDAGPERRLSIKATNSASLAETVEPLRFKGSKILQLDRNMWMARPGLRKPIPISPRQKLSGQAAQGDIASTSYALDYKGSLLRDETFNGESSYVLELTARNKSCTYDRILYWVSKSRLVGVKAEFYSLSGKLLKSATFEYGNLVSHRGRSIPFVSKTTIKDALTPNETTLTYSNVETAEFAAAEFDLSRLGE